MIYAFTFDASACTGCKACQIACKDKNNLPAGVLWRRVYEVSGGTWTNVSADGILPGVWTTDIFAYNLSIACNHCVHPKCAGVCPTDAYMVREDGIVYIDESKCMGCGYCAWACPYAAPQYHPDLHCMTKCNFCYDNIDAGLPPACVAACPMRVLDFKEIREQREENSDKGKKMELWNIPGAEHPFPLPTYSRTEPHLAIKPHAGMVNGLPKTISNREEIRPPRVQSPFRKTVESVVPFVFKNLSELPLLIFTLLGQMAAGLAFFALLVLPSLFLILSIGLLLGLGGLFSFLHLGTKKNVWRALAHLKKSSLSREVLAAGLFGASWLVSCAEHWALNTYHWLPITVLLGLSMVYTMASVYHLRAVPAWNTWRTDAAFFMTAGILGLTGAGLMVKPTGLWFLLPILLAGQLALVLSAEKSAPGFANRLRVALILAGIAGVGIMFMLPGGTSSWMGVLVFLIVFAEETLGRWRFYASRTASM